MLSPAELPESAEAGEVVLRVHGAALGAHPGAEVSGVVIEAGRAARDLLGQPVLVPRLLPCGVCGLCQRGRVSLCPHLCRRDAAPQETLRLPGRFLVPLAPPLFAATAVPAGDSAQRSGAPSSGAPFSGAPLIDELWRQAAHSDALAAPHAGLLRAGLHTGELCVVLAAPGCGFRAAGALLVLAALGCPAVVVSGDATLRQRLCEEPFAAKAALDPTSTDDAALREALRAQARALGVLDHGLCLLETTGSDAGRAHALALAERGGTVVLLDRMAELTTVAEPGIPAPLAAGPQHAGPAALARLCEEGCSIIGAGAPHPDLMPELYAVLQRAGVSLAALTTAVAPEDLDAALHARRRGQADPVTLPVLRFA